MDFNSLVSDLQQLFDLATNTQTSSILIVVGLILLLVGIVIAVKADPATSPLRYVLIGCLSAGVLFCAAGPLFALFNFSKYPIQRVPVSKAFDNLKTNERVSWLIRLIPYDPNPDGQPNLAIGKLTQIGPQEQQYTFVASDDELAGYPVDQAVRMTGISYSPGQRVSAIIFPVPPQPDTRAKALYPANARGVLQVIQNLESDPRNKITNSLFTGQDTLTAEEAADLKNFNALNNWRWDTNFKFYPHYCQIALDFVCTLPPYSARSYISGPNTDWHPLGLAQISAARDPCDPDIRPNFCKVPDLNSAENSWKAMKSALLKSFGSRVFLMQNLKIDSIQDRVLIDFGEPTTEYIPNMTLRPSP
jgi:hypothetical protein